MTLLFALVLVFAGLFIAAKVVKFAIKAVLLGGVAALVYLVVIPQLDKWL